MKLSPLQIFATTFLVIVAMFVLIGAYLYATKANADTCTERCFRTYGSGSAGQRCAANC